MAGRPRRRRASSASTGGSTERSHVRWTKDSSFLKSAPPETPDSEWPSYVLTNATIYRKDGKTLANPLFVNVEGPLVVRGLFEVKEQEAEALDNLLRPIAKDVHVEISRSEQYSIGDGPVTFWVAGTAGWYEIQPSAEYQSMYAQVLEAIKLYYSAFEVYEAYNKACQGRKKSRRPSPPSIDQILLKYAVRAGDGILLHEAKPLLDKWAQFLIAHFDKEVDLDWDATAFATQMREEHPDVVKRLADAAAGITAPPPPPEIQGLEQKAAPNRRSRSVEVRNAAPSRSRSPQPKAIPRPKPRLSETPVPLPEKYRQFSQAASSKTSPAPVATPSDTTGTPVPDTEPESPVDRLLAVLQEIARDNDVRKAAPSSIHSKLYFACKIRTYGGAKDILAYYAKELVPRLGADWRGSPWYEWLKDASKRPWKPTEPMDPEKIPAQTRRRVKSASKPASSAKPATQLPPAINLKARKAAQQETDGESEDDIPNLYVAPPARSRRSGKGATLRLASASKKRPRSDLDEDVRGSHRGRKSARVSQDISDEEEEAEEPVDSSDDEVADTETPVGSRLPLPEGAVRVVVHAERIPTTSPSGPDGTWICNEEDCGYVVRSADEQDAQELIQAHFREHEAQAQKINLAVQESRGHMPINHLLSKIQALGKAALFRKQDTVNGEPVPAPVKRRLLV